MNAVRASDLPGWIWGCGLLLVCLVAFLAVGVREHRWAKDERQQEKDAARAERRARAWAELDR